MTKTVLFVTGAFVSNACWDEWHTYFQSKGYQTHAPAWPFKEGTAAEQRNRSLSDTRLSDTTLSEVIDHYAAIAKDLPEKPIIIGHSLGGMMTQILLNRDLAAAAVAIHPVAPQGIIPYEFSFLKGSWKSLGLFTSIKKTYMMEFKDWQYAFVNGMPLSEQKTAYEKLTVPESKRVLRGGLTSAAKVDFKRKHAPLLITSGEKDNLIPPHLNIRNYRKYKQNGSVLEYKEFPGRNHNVLGQATWKEDADYILQWIAKY